MQCGGASVGVLQSAESVGDSASAGGDAAERATAPMAAFKRFGGGDRRRIGAVYRRGQRSMGRGTPFWFGHGALSTDCGVHSQCRRRSGCFDGNGQ